MYFTLSVLYSNKVALLVPIFIIIGFIAYIRWWVKAKDAPYYPLEADTAFRVLDLVKPTPKDIIYDLGSGDGRNLIAAALKYGAKTRGIEINQLRYWYSSIWIFLLRLHHHIKIIKNDVFLTPLNEATIVITYLLPETHEKLKSKFISDLKPGTKIVAIAFPLAGWKPVKINPKGSIFGQLYLYEMGLSEPKNKVLTP